MDLLYLIQPLSIITVTSLLLTWYHRKKRLTPAVLGLSAIAYFVAIIGKVLLQNSLAAGGLLPSNSYALGVILGLETSVLEIGVSFLVAQDALEKRRMKIEAAPAYGMGLAFWENGVLLGVFALPVLVWAITSGKTALQYGSPSVVLWLVALGTLERVSSILIHFSWGILTVVAAVSGKMKYLYVALPMGFVDALVPFAPSLGLATFELIVFTISLASLLATYVLTKNDWRIIWEDVWAWRSPPTSTVPSLRASSDIPLSPSVSGASNNTKCSKCETVFHAEWNPFLPHMGSLVLRKCPTCKKWSFMGPNTDEHSNHPRE